MTLYHITHKTRYDYRKAVSLSHNKAWLVPRNLPYQQCLSYQLDIFPEPTVCQHQTDFFGNAVVYFSMEDPHPTLEIISKSEVEVLPRPIPNLADPLSWEEARNLLQRESTERFLKARQFWLPSPKAAPSEKLREYAAFSFSPGRPLLEAVQDLTHRIHTDFVFDASATSVSTPLEEVLEKRRGVCQDFSHLEIACLRSIGLAACYQSGYLETLPPPGQKKLRGADASHAWIAVFSPTQGWVEFDPTNDQIASEQYITLAWGRDYGDIVPLKGIIFGGGKRHKLDVAVDVERQT